MSSSDYVLREETEKGSGQAFHLTGGTALDHQPLLDRSAIGRTSMRSVFREHSCPTRGTYSKIVLTCKRKSKRVKVIGAFTLCLGFL